MVAALVDATKRAVRLQYAVGSIIEPEIVDSESPFTFSISPDLPEGLTIHPSAGRIVGTAPATLVPLTTHVITCKGPNGFESSAAVSLEIIAAPEGLAYPRDSLLLCAGAPVEELPTLAAGGAAAVFQVDPPLPDGLTLDEATGRIAGAAAGAAAEAVYTVTAVNIAGQAACELRVAVMEPPRELSYLYGDDGEKARKEREGGGGGRDKETKS